MVGWWGRGGRCAYFWQRRQPSSYVHDTDDNDDAGDCEDGGHDTDNGDDVDVVHALFVR